MHDTKTNGVLYVTTNKKQRNYELCNYKQKQKISLTEIINCVTTNENKTSP